MRKTMERLMRGAFALSLMVALGFGVQQALGSQSAAGLCEGTCPDRLACQLCCIQHGGLDGQCVNPPTNNVCLCIG